MDTITIVNEGIGVFTLYKFQLTFNCLKADVKSKFFPIQSRGKIYNSIFDALIQNMYLLDKILFNKSANELTMFLKGGEKYTLATNDEFEDFILNITK